jgi:large subunit ribosomal protein L24
MQKIRRGDMVVVLRGKDRGKKGRVLEVDPKTGRAKVEGLNLVKKHRRRTSKNPRPTIDSIPAPIPLSALALVSRKDGKKTRVRIEERKDEQGRVRKVRVSVRTGEVFD